MKKSLFVFIISMVFALSLFGCGNAQPAESESSEAESQESEESQAPAEEDGQNPVMNFIGVYSTNDSKEALVEAEGMEDANITVTYAASPWFHDVTVLSGHFDTETLTIDFTNAVQTEYTYNSDGTVKEEKVLYSNGSGQAVFNEKVSTLTITEQLSSGTNVTVYNWGASSDMKTVTDPDHYASVTAMDKAEIETVIAFNARAAYLGENWNVLADMVRYPITINGTELADKDAFLGFMMGATLAEGDRKAMNDEDTLDMFVNGEGICMGDGEIWLSDPNYMTDKEPKLEIIAINGIVNSIKPSDASSSESKEEKEDKKEESKKDEDKKEENKKDGESITVYDEKTLDEFTLYEGTDGYWRDRSGTEYVRKSDTRFVSRDGSKAARTYLPTNDYEDEEEVEVNSERDFYDTYSVEVFDEAGNKYKIYKGSDGYWREEDGTTYEQLSETEFQRKDGNKRVKTAQGLRDDGEEVEEDFYSAYNVIAYDEAGDSYRLYKGSDGYWREEDGTTYEQLSEKEFQLKDGNKHLFVR